MVGNFGACEVLSFHATKFFNTFEGGAILTNDDVLADQVRLMRNFGFQGLDNVVYPGTNGKMTEICAAMGLVNLEHLGDIISRNRENHRTYQRCLQDLCGVRMLQYDGKERNNYQYVVLEVLEESRISRDGLVDALRAENVLARRYFWPGCHRMKPYRDLFPHAGLLLPNTRAVADRVVVLPTGTDVQREDIEMICDIIGRLTG